MVQVAELLKQRMGKHRGEGIDTRVAKHLYPRCCTYEHGHENASCRYLVSI